MKNHGINVQDFRVADGKNDVSALVKELGTYIANYSDCAGNYSMGLCVLMS